MGLNSFLPIGSGKLFLHGTPYPKTTLRKQNLTRLKCLALLFLLGSVTTTLAGTLSAEGIYQGKNLYIQNPFTSSGVGFCTTDVFVNEVRSTDELQSSTFEIDLSIYRLKIGDKVVIKVKYKDDCLPKILNPEVLKPSSTFDLVSAKCEAPGIVKWVAKNEASALPFFIEQYRWNKWVKVAEVQGKGTAGENAYSAPVSLHSGPNKFRIQQTDFKGPRVVGKEIVFKSTTPEVTFFPIKATVELNFSAETMWEIFDQFGSQVKKGKGKKIDISSLEKGPYYLNFDNKTETFIKK